LKESFKMTSETYEKTASAAAEAEPTTEAKPTVVSTVVIHGVTVEHMSNGDTVYRPKADSYRYR
jgi:hypothetical protein